MAVQKNNGIEGLFIETHNWGKTVAFWQELGYKLVFETNHNSGELRHPAGGPYIFLAERPEDHVLEFTPVVGVESEKTFKPPKSAKVIRSFKKEHWGALEMRLADPDGRTIRVQVPKKNKKTKAAK